MKLNLLRAVSVLQYFAIITFGLSKNILYKLCNVTRYSKLNEM